MISEQVFWLSIAAIYHHAEKLKNITTAEELLRDYVLRQKRKKRIGYVFFVEDNYQKALDIATNLIVVRTGKKDGKDIVKVNQIKKIDSFTFWNSLITYSKKNYREGMTVNVLIGRFLASISSLKTRLAYRNYIRKNYGEAVLLTERAMRLFKPKNRKSIVGIEFSI